VIVTHELPSIFAIGNNSVYLDAEAKTMIASGDPKKLRAECENPTVRSFLSRGEEDVPAGRRRPRVRNPVDRTSKKRRNNKEKSHEQNGQ